MKRKQADKGGANPVRRWILMILLLLGLSSPARAEETVIPPAWPVPDYVTHLLEVASEEVGYLEDHGRTKYGEWAGDPYAQWCAEFLCWCVDQVDQRWGTDLLTRVYPRYSASNTGRNWFITAGRYVIRQGQVEGWGYEWLRGEDHYLRSGDYVPQPGDWVFFSWTGHSATEHVAMVEYCTREEDGTILVHVIEGNKPDAVARDVYDLNSSRILGYGTVHDVAEIAMVYGCTGEKVRQLQEKLAYLGWLEESFMTGHFGDATLDALRRFQRSLGLRSTGAANLATQLALEEAYRKQTDLDPEIWTVVEEP